MKLFLQFMILVTAFSSVAAIGSDTAPASVKSVAEPRPCKPAHVYVFGYLHASRHGAWVSDDPGINGKGLPIQLAEFASQERKRLLNYIYRPQENMSNTFSAVFTGTTSCNENGVPVLRVQKVERIKLAPIRDAGVMPNNSFKPKPLRGSA
jgi:hypothetical protein